MTTPRTLSRRARQLAVYARNPELAARRLRGQQVVDIAPAEIARYLPEASVMVEAGAYDGGDTLRMLRQWPAATVYAFEPVPQLYNRLTANTQGLPNVHPQRLALGDRDGTAVMHLSSMHTAPREVSGSSSLLEPLEHTREFPHVGFSGTTTVQVVTLDSWAASAGVERIDFCWLDLQGMELAVLQASPEVVGGLRAVCMEVSRKELYSGAPGHREVLSWMKSRGFRVAIDRTAATYGNVLFVR